MMDCLKAQELVSAALDRFPVDAAELDAAKSHCRECESCGAFVRALLAVQRAEPPAPPEDLADRVMARVRAEAAGERRAQRAAAGATAPNDRWAFPPDAAASAGSARPAAPTRESTPAKTWGELLSRAWEPRNRRAFVAWSAAAAVLFIAAGVGALAGVRAILVPQRTASSGESTYDLSAPRATAPSDSQKSGAAGTASAESATPANSPSFVAFEGSAYRLVGPAPSVDAATLRRLGATRTSLATGGSPRTERVLGSGESTSTVIYLEDADRVLLSFERAVRMYNGRTYALQSGEIQRFGEWPTLPGGMRQPSARDGSPVFEPDGTDERGTPVFRLRGSSADRGIAIAPGAPPGDPVAGSASWSWWLPE